MDYRERLKDKKRIVVKIGSSSLTYKDTGDINFSKLEKLVRVLSNLRNQGKDVVLVSSGAIAVGRKRIGIGKFIQTISMKQACAAVGQAQLMMIYEKLFAEYSQITAQVLMNKSTMMDNESRYNAKNTFQELLKLGVIPVVNENDTVSTYEIEFGDNDSLSAIVAALIEADLLILLSDIEGMYTDDPNTNSDAKLISIVEKIDDKLVKMGKATSGSDIGTGGMATKIEAAKIAVSAGVDMVIASGEKMSIVERIIEGKEKGTLFPANRNENFDLVNYIDN